jgi:transposase
MERRRGRPRPQETILRDDRIVRILRDVSQGLTKYELAEILRVSPSVVYLALRRLKAADRVRHVSVGKRHSWKSA